MSVMWNRRGGKAVIKPVKIPYPSYTDILAYTGSEIQPTWNNYDVNKITISGTIMAVNVGIYTTSFTPSEGFCWEDGTTTAYSVEWTIYKEKLAVPSQSGSLYYNSMNQTPKWNNYDSNKLTLNGTTSAKEIGTYTATFTPKSGYIWTDGTAETKNVLWNIEA